MATKQHAPKTATTQKGQNQTSTSSPASTKQQVERPAAHRPAKAPKKPRPSSGLNAAHAVLLERGRPMTVRDITNAIFEQKLWTTAGKTPHATIAAAIIREIKDKGRESRFTKTGPGLFAAQGPGAPAPTKKPGKLVDAKRARTAVTDAKV